MAPDTYADLRVQEFLLYGNVSQQTQNQQALAVPNARGEHVVDLGPDRGEVVLKANVLGVQRGRRRDHNQQWYSLHLWL